jgi:hypothetical protein
MDGSPQVVRFDATTLWHFDAAEWAPSTASEADLTPSLRPCPLYPSERTFVSLPRHVRQVPTADIAGPSDQLRKRGAALLRRDESSGARPELPTLKEEVRLLELVAGGDHLKLKLARRIKAGHMLLATAAWLAKAREKRKNSCRFGVHSENLGYVYFLY